MTNEEKFISKSINRNGNKYDYSLVKYIDNITKVKIICDVHGVFEQTPHHHKRGGGCKHCTTGNDPLLEKDFIDRSNIIHGGKYDYSLVKYINNREKVNIICREHGTFLQQPGRHLFGQGCRKCNQKKLNIYDILNRFENRHGNKYIYCISENHNIDDYVKIKCPKHDIFSQKISNHFVSGCPKCAGKIENIDDFIQRGINTHGIKYDYSLVEYRNSHLSVKIICKKHGEFSQCPYSHFNGSGCPTCSESKGEEVIRKYLISNGVEYIRQYKFIGCKSIKLLKFDFYLPNNNVCIEYNGRQHYESVEKFGGKTELYNIQMRDKIKIDYCDNNNVKLIIIKYTDKNIDTILDQKLSVIA